jgi:hypothetical protein
MTDIEKKGVFLFIPSKKTSGIRLGQTQSALADETQGGCC